MKHWRLVLGFFVILAIVALVLISPLGENAGGIFGKGLSGFFSIFNLNLGGKGFSFELRADRAYFYGISFNVVNSTFTGKGVYSYIRVSGQNLAFRNSDIAEITINDMNGQFTYLDNGKIRVSAETKSYLINDLVSLTERPVKIEFEIMPQSFVQTGMIQKKLTFNNIVGTVTRFSGTEGDKVSVSGKLEIDNLYGSIRLDNEMGVISGVASSIRGNGFTFG